MPKQITAHQCVYLNKRTVVFFVPEQPDLATLTLTTEVFFDLEIISPPGLERVIQNWLQQTKINPTTLAVLIAEENYFYQDLPKPPQTVTEEEIKAFTDTVPFVDVVTKVFPTQNGARITAINRNLLYPLVNVLDKIGFNVLLVAPAFSIGVSQEQPFSKELAASALKNAALYTDYNYIEATQLEEKMKNQESFFSVQINKRLIAMVIALMLLVAILIGLLVFQAAA